MLDEKIGIKERASERGLTALGERPSLSLLINGVTGGNEGVVRVDPGAVEFNSYIANYIKTIKEPLISAKIYSLLYKK